MDQIRTVLITGATDGLGRRVAERLAGPGIHLIVHGRDAKRGAALVKTIDTVGGTADFHAADFASLPAVRRMAERVAETYAQIDVLINNAGVATQRRCISEDGHELHFAVNYLAHFLLTETLRPCLSHTASSRVINVASASQQAIDFENVMLERGFDGYRAYSQSKLANVMHSFDLAESLQAPKAVSASLHPGSLMDTQMVRSAGRHPLTPVNVGADAVLALVDKPGNALSGRYFDGTREARAHRQAYDLRARQRLRQLSLELTGLAC